MTLDSLQKIDISKALHFFHVYGLDDLLIIVQDPLQGILVRDVLSNKCYIMTANY